MSSRDRGQSSQICSVFPSFVVNFHQAPFGFKEGIAASRRSAKLTAAMAEVSTPSSAIDPLWSRRVVRAVRLAEYSGQRTVDFAGCRPPNSPLEQALQHDLVADFTLRLLAGNSHHGVANPFVVRALLRIDAHACDQRFRVGAVARELEVSTSTLSRKVKAHTGLTVLEQQSRTRMGSAKRLLVETALTVKQVAASVGYDSTSSFDAHFYKATGMTPSEFRRKNT